MKKILSEIHGLTWTLAGTGMVLITLSGDTRVMGWKITIIAIIVHFTKVIIERDKNE
tara:strand:- start:353 stop:523 length:171 start_codon:yes stop_codon:yes gene_type:complete